MAADATYVLELVNQARGVAELHPLPDIPRGKLADCDQCPIARAMPGSPMCTTDEVSWETFPGDSLPLKIAQAWAEPYEETNVPKEHMVVCTVRLPTEIRRWISEFDAGGAEWRDYKADPDD